MSTRIKFHDTEYWMINETDTFFGALAPLEHCDQNGNVLIEHVFSDSFAHLYPSGKIMRYGEQIGTKEDLEVLQLTKGE